ncbi:hypothetical protein BN2537_3663 [Streptomyces venezuelae]|nr:hypothetical protein BN2537_3663 [Streptomyces venezuelae]
MVDLTSGTAELATICRRLLADVAAGADAAPGPSRAGRPKEKAGKPGKQAKPGRRPRGSRHTSPGSWFVLLCVAAVLGAWLYSLFGRAGY